MDLTLEFTSTLAQAQQMIGLGALDRMLGTVAQLATGSQDPSVWDKVDKDQAIDRYADMLGTDPTIIVSDDKVAEIREARSKQQAAMTQAAVAPGLASAAKDLSQADTSGKNGLTDIMKQVQGYGATV